MTDLPFNNFEEEEESTQSAFPQNQDSPVPFSPAAPSDAPSFRPAFGNSNSTNNNNRTAGSFEPTWQSFEANTVPEVKPASSFVPQAPLVPPKSNPEPIKPVNPLNVPIATEAAASFRSKINFEKNKDEELMLPAGEESKGFFTRGRVIAAIGIILAVSLALDRLPASAPQQSNSSDSSENLALISANSQTGNTTPAAGAGVTVKLYFNNNLLDPKSQCDKVFPVERTVKDPSSENILKLLIAGPTAKEGDAGYYTSISPGVPVKGVTVDRTVAVANFGSHLAYKISGNSCRAKAIDAQITQTLEGLSNIDGVKILVDGSAQNVFTK